MYLMNKDVNSGQKVGKPNAEIQKKITYDGQVELIPVGLGSFDIRKLITVI